MVKARKPREYPSEVRTIMGCTHLGLNEQGDKDLAKGADVLRNDYAINRNKKAQTSGYLFLRITKARPEKERNPKPRKLSNDPSHTSPGMAPSSLVLPQAERGCPLHGNAAASAPGERSHTRTPGPSPQCSSSHAQVHPIFSTSKSSQQTRNWKNKKYF